MHYLSPSQYLQWPIYAQRIVFAYNSVPYESLSHISPNEMDFASPLKSPFGPPDPDLTFPDSEDPPHMELTSISPATFVDAVRISVQAFHAFAASHKSFMTQTTQDRLNKHGTPHSFFINDRVKIYIPPTHAQLLRTGRRSNHIVAWRGPCRITRILSPSSYEMEEECSGRKFQRSITNTRPFRASKNPPAHHDLVSSAALQPGTLVAIRDTPTSPFHIAKVTKITEALLSLHYLGTTTPTMDSAVFRLLWLAPDSRTVMKDSCPARNRTAITGEIDTDDMDDLLVASHLTLTSTGRLTRMSACLLFHLRDQLHTY
jgi:hypothetical protein